MSEFDDMFDDKHKVALNHDGEIFKFKDWTPGCRFAGTYIGHHTWTADDGKLVVAHDFAKVTIDGEAQPVNKVYTINEFAALGRVIEAITEGQIVGLKYNGKNTARKGNPHDITPYIDPNNRDPQWRTYAGTPMSELTGKPEPDFGADEEELSPALSTATGEKDEPVEQAFMTATERKTQIQMMVAEHYKLSNPAEVKVKIIEDAELPFNDDLKNLEEIHARLSKKYGK